MIRTIRAPCVGRPAVAAWILAVVGPWWLAAPALGYVPGDRWTTPASGPAGTDGDPITLTWSLAPDRTPIPSSTSSNLIFYLDGLFGAGPGGSDLTQRPWFHLFQECFDRWSQLGGITFVYEPHDSSSVALNTSGGSLGVRGDIRIGGTYVDGPSGTLAYTWLPNSGDMVIDTGETTFYSNSTNNYRQFRNTVTHELGHAFGLLHVVSSDSALLMEPYINTSFDGPQLDDIRGIQGMYGDALEKTNGGQGNDTYQHATDLGTLSSGGTLAIGSDAVGSSQFVSPSETDFVSIANSADADFFSFTLSSPAELNLTLTPLGGVFNQGVEGGTQTSFDANSRNDLALAIFGTSGTTLLASADNTAAGQIESLSGVELTSPGQYYVRVSGADDNVQLYQLQLAAQALLMGLPGDFNGDGIVDAADYTVWRDHLGEADESALNGNGNGIDGVDQGDFTLWKDNFGAASGGGAVVAVTSVPEPASATLLLLAVSLLLVRRRR
jgi:serralysin